MCPNGACIPLPLLKALFKFKIAFAFSPIIGSRSAPDVTTHLGPSLPHYFLYRLPPYTQNLSLLSVSPAGGHLRSIALLLRATRFLPEPLPQTFLFVPGLIFLSQESPVMLGKSNIILLSLGISDKILASCIFLLYTASL